MVNLTQRNQKNICKCISLPLKIHFTLPVDKEKQKKAKAWESAFIEFMQEYVEGEQPLKDKMVIAFSSERSIEDELNRQSRSDIVTVGVSYLIMFLYIAVALGEQHSWRRLAVS